MGKFIHSVGHVVHKVVNKGKKIAKKVVAGGKAAIKKAAPVLASVGKQALKVACKSFANLCPKACDMGINNITPIMKNHHVPTKCFKKIATDSCHSACVEICKGQ